jgi:hypothetical protein
MLDREFGSGGCVTAADAEELPLQLNADCRRASTLGSIIGGLQLSIASLSISILSRFVYPFAKKVTLCSLKNSLWSTSYFEM